MDQLVDKGDQQDHKSGRVADLRNPHRDRDHALRHVLKLEGLIVHLHRVVGEECNERGADDEPAEFEPMARLRRKLVDQETDADHLTGTETFNSGLDFSVAEGNEVHCIADGVVLYTSFMRSYGNFIMIGHNPNYVSIYGNLQEIQVFEDTRVVKDQVIGLSGQTGSLEGPKLHFELRQGMEPLDPREWLKL